MSSCFSQIFNNNAVALLDSNLGPADLSFGVQAGYGNLFPTPSAGEYFLVTLEDAFAPLNREIIKIIGRSGDTLQVCPIDGRGYEGTTAQSWTAGDTLVDHRITAGTLRKLQGNFGSPTTGTAILVGNLDNVSTLDITGPNKTCKWMVTIQTNDGRILMTEVLAVYKSTGPIHNEYARVGDRISYSLNVTSTPTEMVLSIQNTDISDFTDVSVIRIQHFT